MTAFDQPVRAGDGARSEHPRHSALNGPYTGDANQPRPAGSFFARVRPTVRPQPGGRPRGSDNPARERPAPVTYAAGMPVERSDRYRRQAAVGSIGDAGQRSIASGHAVVLGCGALGCTIADLLCRAGVGTLTIIDRDIVEQGNLHRQTLFTEADAQRALPKAEAAAERLARVNQDVDIRAHAAHAAHGNIERLAGLSPEPDAVAPSVLVDGSDNFAARYLLNDVAAQHGVPYVYGGAIADRGTAMTIVPAGLGVEPTPCLRCLWPDPPPPGAAETCETAGVLGPVASMVAAWEASEALKLLAGRTDLITRGLVSFEPWRGRARVLGATKPDPACPCCARGERPFLSGAASADADHLCGRDAVQIAAALGAPPPDLDALAHRLAALGEVAQTPQMTRVQLAAEPVRVSVFADGRAVIEGVGTFDAARAVYDRVIGG